jgi:zinc finger protein
VIIREDLDRQIVKSHTCTVVIPEWELTLPPSRGQLTTIEGLIRDIANDLSADQPLRRIENGEAYKKIQVIVDSLKEIILDTDDEDVDSNKPKPQKEDKVAHSFTVQLDDPSGNSWVEFFGSMADPKWNMRQYNRTRQQNEALGLALPEEDEEPAKKEETDEDDEPLKESEEILVFPGICSSCSHPLDTMMKRVNIPYFKASLFLPVSII